MQNYLKASLIIPVSFTRLSSKTLPPGSLPGLPWACEVFLVCDSVPLWTAPLLCNCVDLCAVHCPHIPSSSPKECALYRKGLLLQGARRYMVKVSVAMKRFFSLIHFWKTVLGEFHRISLAKVFTRSWEGVWPGGFRKDWHHVASINCFHVVRTPDWAVS